jgi:hypothetical protein
LVSRLSRRLDRQRQGDAEHAAHARQLDPLPKRSQLGGEPDQLAQLGLVVFDLGYPSAVTG